MIDLEGVPTPADAPAPGTCVRVERPEDGLVRLHLDPPHRPKLAVFDVPLLRDLDLVLTQLEGDGRLRGLVLAGRAPLSFCGGADVEGIAAVEEVEQAERFVRAGQELFQRLHRLSVEGGGRVLTVAAVGGPVPGGACEAALACDRIVLADHPSTKIGLPEVKLGIFPAWGGTQRLPRRLGIVAALQAILTGRLHPARKALSLGMVDRLAKPDYLWRVAGDIALGRALCARRGRGGPGWWLVDRNPLAGAIVASRALKETSAKTGGHYPAPPAAIPLIVRAPRVSLESGLRNEVEAVKPLAVHPVTKNLARLFLASEEAKKLAELGDGTRARAFSRAAVIGGGVMGGGIAGLLAERGLPTRLRDLEQAPLDEAVHEHRAAVEKKRRRKRLQRHEADAAVDRLETTTAADGFGRCDVVVEAVAEKLAVKRAVFGELAGLMPADAVLATNTSSLSVDAIAEGLPAPERVVGMHFFNPVRLMPLVEIVRGSATSDEVVARVARLALDLGKTPVVTRDVAGFLVNRVLGPYLDEAVRLLKAGVEPAAIDAALTSFGMPMGPCELLDTVGLDIAQHAGASLAEAYGERMRTSDLLAPLVEGGELGQKSRAGVYLWAESDEGRLEKRGANPRLRELARGSASPAEETIVDRLVLALVGEAARALEEEVVAGPTELDLATVFGTGFAPFRGGVLRYADDRGPAAVVERLARIADAPGFEEGERRGRFEPCKLLADLAGRDGRFHG